MSTPGKEAYSRKKAGSSAPKPALNRKKAAMSGADAKSAYVRKKQGAGLPKGRPTQVSRVVSNLRSRLAGGAD